MKEVSQRSTPGQEHDTIVGVPQRQVPEPPGRRPPRRTHTAGWAPTEDASAPLPQGAMPTEGVIPLPETSNQDFTGQVLAERYRLSRMIGRGGMGLVYAAEHMALEKRVAVKVLSREFLSSSEAVARFMQEAKTTSKVAHDNIVEITDFGRAPNGAMFYVMEFLEGEDLGETIQREELLPWPRIRHFMTQICDALEAAHAAGVVHCDMKPENCFRVTKRGDEDYVKILDFGIAKLLSPTGGKKITRTGQIFGTIEYMAPEQIGGKRADTRVDVYAAGVILFELLTGRLPFSGETFVEVAVKHVQEPPPPPSRFRSDAVARAADPVVLRALEKDPDARFQSAAELSRAIRELLPARDATAGALSGPTNDAVGPNPGQQVLDVARPPPPGGTAPSYPGLPLPAVGQTVRARAPAAPTRVAPRIPSATPTELSSSGPLVDLGSSTVPPFARTDPGQPSATISPLTFITGFSAVLALGILLLFVYVAFLRDDEGAERQDTASMAGESAAVSADARREAAAPSMPPRDASTAAPAPTTQGPEPAEAQPIVEAGDETPVAAPTTPGPDGSESQGTVAAPTRPRASSGPPSDGTVERRLSKSIKSRCGTPAGGPLKVSFIVLADGKTTGHNVTPSGVEARCASELARDATFRKRDKPRAVNFTVE